MLIVRRLRRLRYPQFDGFHSFMQNEILRKYVLLLIPVFFTAPKSPALSPSVASLPTLPTLTKNPYENQ